MSDEEFDDLSNNDESLVFEITKEIYEVWVSNIKIATVRLVITDDVDGELSDESTTASQWRIDEYDGTAVEQNLGDHPFPIMLYADKVFGEPIEKRLTPPSTPSGSLQFEALPFLYFEDPADNPFVLTEFGETAFPRVFIHKDVFYASIASLKVPFLISYSLTETSYSATFYEEPLTKVATINNLVLFYP